MSSPNSIKKKYISSTNQKPSKPNASKPRDTLSPKGKGSQSGSVVSSGSGKGTLPSKADFAKFKKRLERPASVEDSFYDKFERLERESSDKIKRITSGKDSSKQKKKESSTQKKRSTSLLDRKRPKSDSLGGVSQKKSVPNPNSFFEIAMKYDQNDWKAKRNGHSRKNSNKKGEIVLRSTSTNGRKSANKYNGSRQRLSASSPSPKRGSSAKCRSVSRSKRNRSKSCHRSRTSRHGRQWSRNKGRRRSLSRSSKSSHKSGRRSATRRGRSRRRKSRSRSRLTSGKRTASRSTLSSTNSSRRNSMIRNKPRSRSSSVTSGHSSVSKGSKTGRGQSSGKDNNTGGKLSATKSRAACSSSTTNSTSRYEIKTKNLKSYDNYSKQKGQHGKGKASQGMQGKTTGTGVKGLKIINDLIYGSSGKTMKMPPKCPPFSNTSKVL